eukprot:TRINITY_DN5057_c0_g1_i7.p1 TRINITY_DN5057_c0_g1~~TRINITY_DN5057_c0_g1_i7.p1  ORF type:complete len:255 (-),score=29.19 TRINITY_DN5057_c0_g1_i7:520-1284(-)
MLQVFRKLCSDATIALEIFDADVTNFRGAVAVGYLCFHLADFHPKSREWVRFASPHAAVAAGFSHFLHRRDFRSRDACAFIKQIFIQILVCGNFSSLCMWRLLQVFRKLCAVAIAALMLFSYYACVVDVFFAVGTHCVLQVARKLYTVATTALEIFDADVTSLRGAVAVGYLCFHRADFDHKSRERARFASPHAAVVASFRILCTVASFAVETSVLSSSCFHPFLACGNFSFLRMRRLLVVVCKLCADAITALE